MDRDEIEALIRASVEKALGRAEAQAAPKPTARQLWTKEWEDFLRAKKSGRTRLTHKAALLDTVIETANARLPMGDLPWPEFNPFVCDLWRRARRLTNTSRGTPPQDNYLNGQLTTLQMFFNYHVEKQRIPRNPVDGWSRVNEEQFSRRTFVSAEEFEKYLAHANPIYQDMCRLQHRCVGLRPGEVRLLEKAEIRWGSVMTTLLLNPDRVKNPNHRQHPIPVPNDVVPILKQRCEYSKGPYVFVRPLDPERKAPISYGTYRHWFLETRAKSGIEGVNGERIVPYHIRHAGLTEALDNGGKPTDVSKAGGTSLKNLDRTYSKFTRQQQEALLAIQNRWGPKKAASVHDIDAERKIKQLEEELARLKGEK